MLLFMENLLVLYHYLRFTEEIIVNTASDAS